MPEAALFITWGRPVRGREKQANDQMRDSLRYWDRLKEEGQIERVDWAALLQQGGDLWGVALLRGSAEQIDALRGTEEFGRWVVRLGLVADQVAVIDAVVDEALIARNMNAWDETVQGLD